jgi:ParB/RepB/Spo0J family partition protein
MTELLDPNSILIPSTRQRSSLDDLADIQPSIARNGLINAIVVRQDGDSIVVVAGARRTKACQNLGKMLEVGRDVRFWDDLDPAEAEIVELEENLKRLDLPWRDQVRAVARLHKRYLETHEYWNQRKTAEAISCDDGWVTKLLAVNAALEAGHLTNATDIGHAYSVALRIADRKAESIVNAIINGGQKAWQAEVEPEEESSVVSEGTQLEPATVYTPPAPPTPVAPLPPVLNASFLEWAPAYTGPRFNLLHCDFPYGVYHGGPFGSTHEGTIGDDELYENTPDLYWALTDVLLSNLDRLASHSCHIMFWFSMTYYTETVRRLRAADLFVHDHPLIWHKSDGRGIAPGRDIYPKRTYDTCLLASRGGRNLVKQGANSYPAPAQERPIHPSQKNEAMLRFFMTMLVDETTRLLDPTCGSGSALRAADSLGAAFVLGLEVNPEYVETANEATLRARRMREAMQ